MSPSGSPSSLTWSCLKLKPAPGLTESMNVCLEYKSLFAVCAGSEATKRREEWRWGEVLRAESEAEALNLEKTRLIHVLSITHHIIWQLFHSLLRVYKFPQLQGNVFSDQLQFHADSFDSFLNQLQVLWHPLFRTQQEPCGLIKTC